MNYFLPFLPPSPSPSPSPSPWCRVQGVVVLPLPGSRASGGGEDEAVQATRAGEPEGPAEAGPLPVQQGEGEGARSPVVRCSEALCSLSHVCQES